MKVQCKTCKRLHVNGEWTNETEVRIANVYTFCPDCYEKFLCGIPANRPMSVLSPAHTSVS